MDRLIYVAMNGAKHTMERQAAISHNLANASTAGFRAALNAYRALPVIGPGAGTRAFVVDTTGAANFRPGPVTETGRALDVAVTGEGWIAVQAPDGREAYTRAGDLQITGAGQLKTRDGLNVIGEAGPITVPPNSEVTIGEDGTVSAIPTDDIPNAVNILGRIKLVNPSTRDLVRGDDGLFRLRSGVPAPPDANVQLASGALEGSNVSVVESLVDMIAQARHFETQIKLIQSAENNSRQWSQILNMAS